MKKNEKKLEIQVKNKLMRNKKIKNKKRRIQWVECILLCYTLLKWTYSTISVLTSADLSESVDVSIERRWVHTSQC